ncbi:MAG: helix-turn-helix transcriptional regulator, partial [Nevskiales bacterium]
WNEIELFFDYPQPSYYPKYQTRLPPTRFNTGVIQLRFDEKYLDFKPETANPVTARMVEEQCLREMEQLGLAGDLVKQVRSILETGGERYPSLGFVAEHLHMSERSLKRKLREQGASYRQLLDAVRYQDSIRLLQESQLNIEQVAVQLGYTDPANFTRAFRKWSGVTPSEYRHMRR